MAVNMNLDNSSAKQRSPRFNIEVGGDEGTKRDILDLLKEVKHHLKERFSGKQATTADALYQCMQHYLKDIPRDVEDTMPSQYVPVTDPDEKQFVMAESSFGRAIEIAEHHGRYCHKKLAVVKGSFVVGHVGITKVTCGMRKHQYSLSSSPYLANKRFLVNARIAHGMYSSGMLPVQYTRFCDGAGIGRLSKTKRKEMEDAYKIAVADEERQSRDVAMDEEVFATAEANNTMQVEDDDRHDERAVEVMSDARHGWRKNAKDSSVVFLGERTHKALKCIHVTKREHPHPQTHEYHGTVTAYAQFEQEDISINVHTHDRNLSVNKHIRETYHTTNQNDTWHAVKSLRKQLDKVSRGPKKTEGSQWFPQIADKVDAICTHANYSLRNCNKSTTQLQASLLNILNHYKNVHDNCHCESRCRTVPNYEPSRLVIRNPKAASALQHIIQTSVLYTHPQDYILARHTSYVESFNNVMNIFQDKRIAFSDAVYNMRGQLAVCHWNENVDRAITSVYQKGRMQKKTLKACSYRYRTNIWRRFVQEYV